MTRARQPRIGLLWRGDRRTEPPSERADRVLGPLFEAFDRLPAAIESVIYADDAVDEVRSQLLGLDGVLVWVNPIQDGATRSQLDELLREVAARGVWISAHPDVILKMGTKEVLYRTRELGWGTDTDLYRSPEELASRFPGRLRDHGRLVVKQGRGTGGNGVWKVVLLDAGDVGREARVSVQDARSADGSSELMTLGAFMDRCEECFAWSGCLVDQEYQERLGEGMLRCYLTHDQVVGFCHQWPKALLDPAGADVSAGRQSVMEGPDTPAFQELRRAVEGGWVGRMREILDIDVHSLPVIWDADFLYGPRTPSGHDTYVLCEINISAVWPFPSMAASTVASAALARVQEIRGLHA